MGWLDDLFGWFPGGAQGAGMVGALGMSGLNDYFASKSAQKAAEERRKVYDLLLNPQLLASQMASARTPLSADTMTQINRGLNTNLAMRGISEPGSGVGSQYVADAYAKILPSIQAQQDANYLSALTGASAFAPQAYGKSGSMNDTLKWLMIANSMNPAKPTTTPQAVPNVAATSFTDPSAMVNWPWSMNEFDVEDTY